MLSLFHNTSVTWDPYLFSINGVIEKPHVNVKSVS